jgi:hypothetical protein
METKTNSYPFYFSLTTAGSDNCLFDWLIGWFIDV